MHDDSDLSHVSDNTTLTRAPLQESNSSRLNASPQHAVKSPVKGRKVASHASKGAARPSASISALSTQTAFSRPPPRIDRFVPRFNTARIPGQVPEALADAFGVRMTRVLEFGEAPPLQRRFAPADFVGQYAHHALAAKRSQTMRYISSKPEKILDCPGLVDDFYLNVLDWSPSLDVMAIGLSNCVYAWNPNSGEASVVVELAEDQNVTSVKWSQEDSCLAVGSSAGQILLCDGSSGALLRTMRARRDRIGSLSWNEHLVSGGGRDGGIGNHDVRIKRHRVSELHAHTGEVCGLAWRSDGAVLASGGNDNAVNLWDARVSAAPQYTLTQHTAAVKALAWCPWHLSLLATGGGSADQRVNFWNAGAGSLVRELDTGAQVTSLHWSEHHRELAATLGYPFNSVNLYAYPSLEQRAVIEHAHDARILAATLSADGQTLATCAGDESLKMWNVFEGKPKRTRRDIAGIIGRV